MNEINPAPVGADSAVPESQRQWAAAAHIAALVLALCTSWLAGVAGMLGAGVVYLVKRDDSPFVAAHAREAFNFNLSMFIYAVAACIIGFLLLGATVLTLGIGLILTLPAGLALAAVFLLVSVAWLVCSIIGAMKAWGGESYRYPFTIRLL
jgi:uncharacterized Tic20 family protein